MSASRISLDGTWQFLHSSADRPADPVKVRSINVPGPWQAQFKDLRMRAGIGIYQREFEVPEGWREGRVFLHFGAVFHSTRVWINGIPAGTSEGGFLPFFFDVTEHLIEGRNEVKLRVESPTDNPIAFPDAPFAEIPFGKQSWYGPLSGIWQPVYLECRDVDHLVRARIHPDNSGKVKATVFLHRPLSRDCELVVEILDPSGAPLAETRDILLAGAEEACVHLSVDNPHLWSPDAPNLYHLRVSLHRHGLRVDEWQQHFGFRHIEARNGRFYLNGEPLYLRGALDQDYYPETICTVPSLAFLEDQCRKAKELGLNCLRCHIKPADPRYYDVADRLGILIWTELPNGGLSTERSRARKERLLKGIVDRDGHHPSIIIWTIINENWGVDLVHDADHRDWLKRTYHWLKSYDPMRLVVDNSPLAPSFHVETDITDYHFYAAFPDHRAKWDHFIDGLAARADFLYSTEGDAVMTGEEPIICSEFGNWGLPLPDDLKDEKGEEPWWFETGHDWGEGVMYAHGVENRFTDWSLDRPFGDLNGFVAAAQWQQFRALKYEIESMRRRHELGGYVITEFTDVHWESNGLLDMRRNPRAFHDRFSTINADTVIVPEWTQLAARSDEILSIGFSLAHGAGAALRNAVLNIPGNGRHTITNLQPGSVMDLGLNPIHLPKVTSPTMHRIEFTLENEEGAIVTSNSIEVAVYPTRQPSNAALWSPEGDIRDALSRRGFTVSSTRQQCDLVIASYHDKEIVSHVRDGGRLLLLPEEGMSLYPFFPHWQNVNVKAREGSLWAGDWASSFSWLTRQGAFGSIPGGPLIDETMERIIPRHVISGANLLDFQARVHAGLVVGWIHKPVALTIERAYGKGRLVASVFRLLRDEAGEDPAADALLDAHIELALAAGRIERVEEKAAV